MYRLKNILILTMLLGSTTVWAQSVRLQSSQDVTVKEIKVDIYPNPATDFLTVELDHFYSGNVEFELRSMIGNSIRINPESIGINKYRIQLKDYATGYYFLIVKDERARMRKAFKFLKR